MLAKTGGNEREESPRRRRLHACRAAVEEGILPGGGVAVIRARKALAAARKKATGDEKVGVDIIDRARPHRSSKSPKTAALAARWCA